jgi:hypothetical protein
MNLKPLPTGCVCASQQYCVRTRAVLCIHMPDRQLERCTGPLLDARLSVGLPPPTTTVLHGQHAFDNRRHDGFSFVVLALQILLGELPYGEEASESAASSLARPPAAAQKKSTVRPQCRAWLASSHRLCGLDLIGRMFTTRCLSGVRSIQSSCAHPWDSWQRAPRLCK